MVRRSQTRFSSGEIHPRLHSRVDFDRYYSALALARNFVVSRYGGVDSRPGTEFIGPIKDSAQQARLITYEYGNVSYFVEIGNTTARFIRDGAYILTGTTIAITGITNAALPVVSTGAPHPYNTGDKVFITGVVGMEEVNNTFFEITKLSAITFALNYADTTGYGTYSSGGTIDVPYEVATPWGPNKVFDLRYAQDEAEMVFTHDEFNPRELERVADNNWTVSSVGFGSSVSSPTGLTITPFAPAATTWEYAVTAVDDTTGEESLAVTGSIANGAAAITPTTYNTVSWTNVAGVTWNVYRAANGVYGFIGSAATNSFKDIGYEEDILNSPPNNYNPFSGSGNYPRAVSIYQQRLMLAGSTNEPGAIRGSTVAHKYNFNRSFPIQDDDALEFALKSQKFVDIQHLIPVGNLLALTSNGEWRVADGVNGVLTPGTFSAREQTTHGISSVPPLVVGNTILFAQERGQKIRDLFYSFENDTYAGSDLTFLAGHLFPEGVTVKDWAYAKEPNSTIWIVLSDGNALSLTYVPEQEMIGWCRHETDGTFLSVAAGPEGDQTAVYFIIERDGPGGAWRNVERLNDRQFTSIEDYVGLDSYVTYDSPINISNITKASPGVVTSGTHGFANDDMVHIRDVVGMVPPSSSDYSSINRVFQVKNVTATTFELYDPVEAAFVDTTSYTAYTSGGTVRKQVTELSGLQHLEGQTVDIFADGGNVGTKTVANAQITLDDPASIIHVGYGYNCDLETLPLDSGPTTDSEGTVGKQRSVGALYLSVYNTRGVRVGPSENDLRLIKERADEPWGDPTDMTDSTYETIIEPQWNDQGRVFLRVSDHTPASILGIMPDVDYGDG